MNCGGAGDVSGTELDKISHQMESEMISNFPYISVHNDAASAQHWFDHIMRSGIKSKMGSDLYAVQPVHFDLDGQIVIVAFLATYHGSDPALFDITGSRMDVAFVESIDDLEGVDLGSVGGIVLPGGFSDTVALIEKLYGDNEKIDDIDVVNLVAITPNYRVEKICYGAVFDGLMGNIALDLQGNEIAEWRGRP